jgi:pyridoxamine 5'-phosphate oxidase family protein
MGLFTDAELDYLHGERRLARVATVGPDGTPHVAPVGWRFDPDHEWFEVGGMDLTRTRKFRDVARTGRAALVIDDVLPPWQPRGVEVRGRAEAIEGDAPVIRIHPDRVVTWGIQSSEIGARSSRSRPTAHA